MSDLASVANEREEEVAGLKRRMEDLSVDLEHVETLVAENDKGSRIRLVRKVVALEAKCGLLYDAVFTAYISNKRRVKDLVEMREKRPSKFDSAWEKKLEDEMAVKVPSYDLFCRMVELHRRCKQCGKALKK